MDVAEVFEFSPLLADKFAIKIKSNNDIDLVINQIENKIGFKKTSIEMLQEKIDYLLVCNEDRRNKYFLDLENRLRSIFLYQQEIYNWYTSEATFNDKNPWDDLLVSKRASELRLEYNIPNGVWLNEEPFSWKQIDRAIELCSQWVFRNLNFEEAYELYFLLEEVLDTDMHFILYGFPHLTIRKNKKDVYRKSEEGIFEVGIKNAIKRNVSKNKYENTLSKIFTKYFGR